MTIRRTLNQVTLAKYDRMIGGVCGGFAEATEVASWVWRAGFVFSIAIGGLGFFVYLILWCFMPRPKDTP